MSDQCDFSQSAREANLVGIAFAHPKLVSLYKVGRLKLDELITARYPPADINNAIDLVVKAEAMRNVIVF